MPRLGDVADIGGARVIGPIRVLLADDQPLLLASFASLIAATPGMCVAGTARTGTQAVAPGPGERDRRVRVRGAAGRASGFLGKSAEPRELIDAIPIVHRDDALLTPAATRSPRQPHDDRMSAHDRAQLVVIADESGLIAPGNR